MRTIYTIETDIALTSQRMVFAKGYTQIKELENKLRDLRIELERAELYWNIHNRLDIPYKKEA